MHKPQVGDRTPLFTLGHPRSSHLPKIILLATPLWFLLAPGLLHYLRGWCLGVSSYSYRFFSSRCVLGFYSLQGAWGAGSNYHHKKTRRLSPSSPRLSPPRACPPPYDCPFFSFLFQRLSPLVSPCCLIRSFTDKQWLFLWTTLSPLSRLNPPSQ